MPPCWAIAMARCDSVTVSIADDETGMLTGMLREKRVVVSASVGRTSLRAGMRVTSSKVRASWISPASIINTSNICAPLGRLVNNLLSPVEIGDAQDVVAGFEVPSYGM